MKSRILCSVYALALALLPLAPAPACLAQEKPAPQVPSAAPALTPEQAEALRSVLHLAPGTKVEVDISSKDGGTVRTVQKGRGVGAGATAEGDKLNDQLTGSAPSVGLGDGGSATGGGLDRKTKADALKIPPVPWQNPLFWLGILCLLGAGVLAYLRLPGTNQLKLIVAATGVGCLAVAFYPALLLWGVAAILAVLTFVYFKNHMTLAQVEPMAQRTLEATRAVAAGIEDPSLPDDLRKLVKEKIALHASEQDVDTIDAVKQADKLGKYA